MRSRTRSYRHLSPEAFGRVLARLSAKPVRHALGFVDEIRRRCVVNKEAACRVASDLDLCPRQTAGVVNLLKAGQWSPERLACIVMLDWGMEDEDIAQIFGRSVKWAQVVRSQADEIRAEETVPEGLQWLDDGLQPTDPSPSEIASRAAELRAGRSRAFMERAESPVEVSVFAWRETNGTFVPISAA